MEWRIWAHFLKLGQPWPPAHTWILFHLLDILCIWNWCFDFLFELLQIMHSEKPQGRKQEQVLRCTARLHLHRPDQSHCSSDRRQRWGRGDEIMFTRCVQWCCSHTQPFGSYSLQWHMVNGWPKPHRISPIPGRIHPIYIFSGTMSTAYISNH